MEANVSLHCRIVHFVICNDDTVVIQCHQCRYATNLCALCDAEIHMDIDSIGRINDSIPVLGMHLRVVFCMQRLHMYVYHILAINIRGIFMITKLQQFLPEVM